MFRFLPLTLAGFLLLHFKLKPDTTDCTYAHGPEELQMTKLRDFHDAGLIDMDTFRTKPCLTWIMTGSCPFGKRCTGIHDARVDSRRQSWLPHTETQGNTIATDINVDALHQKRLHAILYDNPFGDQLDLSEAARSARAAFDNLYGLVACGGGGAPKGGGWNSGKKGRGPSKSKAVHPIYKLQIALKLRGDADWHYKYRPQHVVHDELCMVLNKRAYRVTSNDHNNNNNNNNNKTTHVNATTATATSSVVEISLNAYNPKMNSHILVHEIAFGPDSDPSVRGVALWFNIDECEVSVCTPQQAKRFRWKKTATPVAAKTTTGKTGKVSVFDSGVIHSFPMIRPHDETAFRLATDMMKHQLGVLKRERMSSMKERHENLAKLNAQKKRLFARFQNQLRDWVSWAWPINLGREHVDSSTPVPPVEGPYVLVDPELCRLENPADENTETSEQKLLVNKGANVHRIWNSFLDQCPPSQSSSESLVSPSLQPFGTRSANVAPRHHRLSIFEELAYGTEIDPCRALPHILKHRAVPGSGKNSKKWAAAAAVNPLCQQERCWKALLLQPKLINERNEWDIVRDHFENSRSKKVLTILQQ